MLNLGIDLSTTNTGIGLVSIEGVGSKKIVYSCIVQLWDNNYITMYNNCVRLVKLIEQEVRWNSINIGIELSNFSSAKLTTRFNFLCGMLISAFINSTIKKLSIKVFNANEWYKYIGNLKDKRVERKKASKRYVLKHYNYKCETDDESDAICIATYITNCRDNQEITECVKKAKKEHKQQLSDKLKIAKHNEYIWRKINKAKRQATKDKLLKELK